jgi:hypothetical protein
MSDFRAWILGLGLLACEAEPTELPGPSYTVFRDQVYPLLLRDCGFAQCHGDSDRFYVLYGPGRARLDPEIDVLDPPTSDELWFAYQSTRGMLTSDRGVLDSPLLTKPLEGVGHGGLDSFGRNVWPASDPAWQTIGPWAEGLR